MSDVEETAYAKVTWRLIPFLFLCYILAFVDRVNVSFAKLQMQHDLGMSDTVFGIGMGIFFIGYFLRGAKQPGAQEIRRAWIARRDKLGAISAATMCVTGELGFYTMRFVLGLAEAGFFPGIVYYLTIWYPSRLRATRTAWFVSAVALAGVIGNPVSGIIMDRLSGALGLAGWQWIYLLEGLPSVAVGVWVIFYLDSGIQEAAWLTREEKAVLAGAIESEENTKSGRRLNDAFKAGPSALPDHFTLVRSTASPSGCPPCRGDGVTGYRDGANHRDPIPFAPSAC
jgi:MFS family permease